MLRQCNGIATRAGIAEDALDVLVLLGHPEGHDHDCFVAGNAGQMPDLIMLD